MSKILSNMVQEMFDDVFIHEFTYWIDGGKAQTAIDPQW